jgi:PLD-like domain
MMAQRTFETWREGQIEGIFLLAADREGQGAQAEEMAKHLAAFISGAKFNIHMAIYDFRLDSLTAAPVVAALRAKDEAGLTIRIAYHQERQTAHRTQQDFAHTGGDPAPPGTEAFLAVLDGTDIERNPINGHGHLMHNKYIIRDAMTPDAAVWMGSANFTDGAWSLQENNVLILNSPDLAQFYETDFWELWTTDSIATTGRNDTGKVEISNADVSVFFSPGEGREIDLDIAQRIGAARKRLLIASMDISSARLMIASAAPALPWTAFSTARKCAACSTIGSAPARRKAAPRSSFSRRSRRVCTRKDRRRSRRMRRTITCTTSLPSSTTPLLPAVSISRTTRRRTPRTFC